MVRGVNVNLNHINNKAHTKLCALNGCNGDSLLASAACWLSVRMIGLLMLLALELVPAGQIVANTNT